jgi:GABA permease
MSDERTERTAPGRRILVIANETVAGAALHQAIRFRARHGSAEVLVVVPVLPGRFRRPPVGTDRAAAEDRLARALKRLRAAGVRARGQLADADPLAAIDGALGVFAADEVLVATHPEARSGWLAGDLVARARARFSVPVLHVVVQGPQGGGGSGPRPGPRPGPRSGRRRAAPTFQPTLSAS